MTTDIKLSKTQIKKIIQSGGFLGSLLGKIADSLMKVVMPLARNVLAPLGLTAAMSAIDGGTTGLIIANEDMDAIMTIIKALENSGILLKVGQRENSFTRGFYYYLQQSYLVYEYKQYFFRKINNNRLITWRSSGIDNLSANSDLKAIPNAQGLLPIAENNGRMNVEFNGNYFVQNKVLQPNNNKVVNIYIV